MPPEKRICGGGYTIFYGLPADRQKYCFTKVFFFFFIFFLKFVFEFKPLFFQIRIKNLLGAHPH